MALNIRAEPAAVKSARIIRSVVFLCGLAVFCTFAGLYMLQYRQLPGRTAYWTSAGSEHQEGLLVANLSSLIEEKVDQLTSLFSYLQVALNEGQVNVTKQVERGRVDLAQLVEQRHVDLTKQFEGGHMDLTKLVEQGHVNFAKLVDQVAQLQCAPASAEVTQERDAAERAAKEELAKTVAEVDRLKSVRERWMNDTREVLRTSNITDFDVVVTTIPRISGAALLKGVVNNLVGAGVTNAIYIAYGRTKTNEMDYVLQLADEYHDRVRLEVLALSTEVWDKVKQGTIAAKTAANEWQALSIKTNGKPLVRIEDDVQLASFFNVRLSKVLEDLQRALPGRAYVLDLCVPYDLTSLPEVAPGVVVYPENAFWGTQGLLISPGALDAGIGKYYYDTGVEIEPVGLQDMMLKEFIKENEGYNVTNGKVLLLALTRSLVQHVGQKSTRGGDSSWQVENFVDNIKV